MTTLRGRQECGLFILIMQFKLVHMKWYMEWYLTQIMSDSKAQHIPEAKWNGIQIIVSSHIKKKSRWKENHFSRALRLCPKTLFFPGTRTLFKDNRQCLKCLLDALLNNIYRNCLIQNWLINIILPYTSHKVKISQYN